MSDQAKSYSHPVHVRPDAVKLLAELIEERRYDEALVMARVVRTLEQAIRGA